MIQSSGKKSAVVLIPEVLLAITNSEMIFKISSSMVVLLLSFPLSWTHR
jgi:TRAP-type mannitol/chloroaromatic compound transport system permease large subunit